MNKISITIDVSKVTKEKIIPRAFTDNQGHEIIAKDYKLDIIPLREVKVLKSGADWELVKVAFVAEAPSEEEKKNKTKTKIIGSAIEFRKPEVRTSLSPEDIENIRNIKEAHTEQVEEVDVDSIPF